MGVLFYLLIGAIFHLILIGAHFDWSSADTWFVMFGWPFIMLAFGVVATLIVGLLNAILGRNEWYP